MSDLKFLSEPLLDSDQAAAILRIHPKTLQRLARHGRRPRREHRCPRRLSRLWCFAGVRLSTTRARN